VYPLAVRKAFSSAAVIVNPTLSGLFPVQKLTNVFLTEPPASADCYTPKPAGFDVSVNGITPDTKFHGQTFDRKKFIDQPLFWCRCDGLLFRRFRLPRSHNITPSPIYRMEISIVNRFADIEPTTKHGYRIPKYLTRNNSFVNVR
jgi:hypothetical protein